VWSRVGSSNFLKPFSRVAKIFYYLKKGKGISNYSENYRESVARRKDLFGKSPVFKLVGVSILILEMLWRYFFKVVLPIFFKKAVICDRYIFDTLVDIKTRYGIDLNTKEGRLFKKILTRLTPKPDVAYVLLIPFEEACSRENIDVRASDLVVEQISSYNEITKLFNLHQINTSNNSSIEDISDKMIYETLTRYYNKWPARKSHFN
jgi:dTMP kinase